MNKSLILLDIQCETKYDAKEVLETLLVPSCIYVWIEIVPVLR